jgi:uncharacterized damage-inducible protein DinB
MPGGVEVPPGQSDERELLLSWLSYLRAAVVRKASGLTDEQARWRPEEKLLSLAGLVNHLTRVEWRWIDGGFLGAVTDRVEQEFYPSQPITKLLGAYADRASRTDEVVRAGGLDRPCRTEPGTDLRWVLLHLINETARHAGHADAVRELLDGLVGE